jgi:cytochrome b pre-mRNA-processing protein 3
MVFPFVRRSKRCATISGLYGTIVAQARMPCFYRDYAVPDTLRGRFELIVLHLALLLDRLAADPAMRKLGQAVFDQFCRDMDHNLREIGVGDLAARPSMAAHSPTARRWRPLIMTLWRRRWRGISMAE